METIRIILLILSVISGFICSFIGGYHFGKYKEGQLTQKWFEKVLETEKQLEDIKAKNGEYEEGDKD